MMATSKTSLSSPVKIFVDRESPLTVWSRTDTGKFWVVFFSLCMSIFWYGCFLSYLVNQQVLWQDIYFVWAALEKQWLGWGLWTIYHLILVAFIYPLSFFVTKENARFATTYVFISISTGVAFMMVSLYAVANVADIGPLVKMAITEESARLLFKVWSFAVEKAKHPEDPTTVIHFLYFLFIPTAIYRPSYPMRNKRNYIAMIAYIWIMGSLALLAVKMSILTANPFMQLVQDKATRIPLTLAVSSTGCSWFAGLFYLLIAFNFGGLHCWSNFFAEVFYFGDREFYKDWRLSENPNEFWITWNAVVQEWLREYIYEPARQFLQKRNQSEYAGPIVMFFSGILHDYVTIGVNSVFLPIFTVGMTLFSLIPVYFNVPWNVKNVERNNSKKTDEETRDENKNISSNGHIVKPKFQIPYQYGSLLVLSGGIGYLGFLLEYYSRKICAVDHDETWINRLGVSLGIRTLSCIDFYT